MRCDKCNGVCCKTYAILINSADARRIVANLIPRISPLEYLKIYEQEIGAGEYPLIFLNNTVGGVLGLAQREENQGCAFLSEAGRCEIHPFKPLVCLIYPYHINSPMCPVKWEFDERVLEPLINQYIQEDLEFQKEVGFWNENYSDKDFAEFLRFIKCL